jgi:manganese-dependent inorganic pyrophosphatase
MEAGAVVFCGEQEDVIREALEKKAGCVILCQSGEAGKYRGIESGTCVIATPLDVWRAARALYQAIPVERIARRENLVCFRLEDYLDDVRETVLQSRYRSYPVLDRKNHVVGTLSRYHLIQPKRKRIVLVDHNETSQSVPGLEQAELVGIIDHHRLGDVETGYPVFMRNEPLGSANTIIATMFQEHGLMPPEKLAGLMAAAIISDTVMFKSPTTTPRDRRIAERLARIAGIDLDALGKEVFSASSADKSAEVLLNTDFKEFHIADHKLGISQITTMDSAAMLGRMEEFLGCMEKMKAEKQYDMALLMITDVLREGTELVFLGDREIIRQAFSLGEISENHVFLKGVVSRKKQMVPALALLWG